MKASRWVRVILGSSLLASLPFTVDSSTGVRATTACAQDENQPIGGTCCPQFIATCVISGAIVPRNYYRGEGRCT